MDNFNPELTLARDQIDPDQDRRQLARRVPSGQLLRLARGAYFPVETWNTLDKRGRHGALIMAILSTTRSKHVLSHQSAAAVWGLPMISAWPNSVHVTVAPGLGTRSRNQIVRHTASLADEDVVEFDQFYVTSLERTVLDIAATCGFLDAVAVADHAILLDRYGRRPPLTTRDALERAWERAKPIRAHLRTKAVLNFAETSAESPLESVSRVHMRTIGVPRPQLQLPLYDARGYIGDVDFAWEGLGIVAEADGDIKYLDPAFRAGRSADQVVLDEKMREDRIRALPRRMARWRWAVAMDPAALKDRLKSVGLPTGLKW